MEAKKEGQAFSTATAAKRKATRVVTSRAPTTAAAAAAAAAGAAAAAAAAATAATAATTTVSKNGSVPHSSSEDLEDDVLKQGLAPSRKRPRVTEDWLIHPPDGSVSVCAAFPVPALVSRVYSAGVHFNIPSGVTLTAEKNNQR